MVHDGDYKSLDDEELARIIGSRDSSPESQREAHAAFEELHARHAAMMLSLLKGKLPCFETANDTAQDLWNRVWVRAATFRGGNFKAWVYRIAHNLIADYYGNRRPEKAIGETDPEDYRVDAETESTAELVAKLKSCLEKLDENRRRVVVARLEGHDYRTISKMLGIKYGTAQTRYHSAKSKLQDCVNVGSE